MAVDLRKLQKDVLQNKIDKGFNTTDISLEFCRAYEELAEAFAKLNKHEDGVAEEFADVMIFILGMCEMLGYDLESELISKINKNKQRTYKRVKSPDGKDVFIRVKTRSDP